MKYIKLYLLACQYSFKVTMYHPIGACFFFMGKLVRFGMFFLFIFYLLSHTRFLAGYNLTQTIIFFLSFNVLDSMAQFLFREVYRFRPIVVNGELDDILVKPFHPFMRILLGGADLLDLVIVILYIGMLAVFIGMVEVTSLHLLYYILLMINGLIIALAFHIIALALGIFTTEVDQTLMIYRDATRLATVPLDIYKEPIRSIFTFIVPIGIMMTFPVKALFGLLSLPLIIISFCASFFLLLFSLYLWKIALKKYQSWGG